MVNIYADDNYTHKCSLMYFVTVLNELLQYCPTYRLNYIYLAPHHLVYEYEGSIVSTLKGELKRVRSHTC